MFAQIQNKTLTQKEAAKLLKRSVRQIKRLYKKYKLEGPKALVSSKIGKASNNRLDKPLKTKALDIISEKYADFSPPLAREKLLEVHDLHIPVTSTRSLMIEAGLWEPCKVQTSYCPPTARNKGHGRRAYRNG